MAVAADRRSAALPDLASAIEAGVQEFQASIWVAAMVSIKTPKPETDKLAEIFSQIERMPETREFLEKQGAEVMAGGPEELRNFQSKEIQLWKKIVQKAHVELQGLWLYRQSSRLSNGDTHGVGSARRFGEAMKLGFGKSNMTGVVQLYTNQK